MAQTASILECNGVAPTPNRPCEIDIDAFLFDVDGVLADTADLHAAAWKRAANESGITVPEAVIPLLRGRSREDSLRLILGHRELPTADFVRVMDRKNGYYVAGLASLTPSDALPGAAELLSDLSRAGIRLAAVSASRNARTVLTRIGLMRWFERVVDGLVEMPRGQSNRYAHVAAAMRCDPARCVVVEDSQAGIELAHAAGMRVIGLGRAVRDSQANLKLDSLCSASVNDLLLIIGAGAANKINGPTQAAGERP